MKRISFSLAMALLATPVLAQSAAEQTGVNSMIGAAPTTEDFVMQAAQSDMYEIESSKLALERADGDTKAFAEQMITAHEKTSSDLKALVEGGTVKTALPDTMTDDQSDSLAELDPLRGAEFSEEYIDDQVDAHEDAVDLFERYAEGGDNPELKAWAAKTLPDLQHHLKMAQDMDK